MKSGSSLFRFVHRCRAAWVSDTACAQCGKPERPWRRMLWYPFSGSTGGAFICSDRCWEAFGDTPKFAVRIARGLVTHWREQPLTSFEMADECRRKIEEVFRETGEVEVVL